MERDFTFTEGDFDCIRGLVRRHTGIALSDAKKDMVYSRLARRLRQLGLHTFKDYCRLITDGDQQELAQLTNAITTNLTSFFREQHHFDFLAQTLIPSLLKEKASARRLRIWSAGCSTGEEPYSIAMVLKECLPPRETWDVKILATDLDSNVLATARQGVYSLERLNGIATQRRRRWFLKGTAEHVGSARVIPELQAIIAFKQLNLLHQWPMKGPFDFIFCRNVVIYFNKETQKVLFDRYADMLAANGHLFIGHSETLFKVSDRFQSLGKTIYRKTR